MSSKVIDRDAAVHDDAPRLKGKGTPLRERVFHLSLWASWRSPSSSSPRCSPTCWRGWSRLDPRLWMNFPDYIDPTQGGARSAIMGTVWVIGFTAVYCLPTGILTAIYLEEYADQDKWLNRAIEINIQNLAAVPSIVYGILGLGIISRGAWLRQTVLTAS